MERHERSQNSFESEDQSASHPCLRRDVACRCGNPHSGTGGERGARVSGTDPKLEPHKAAQPVLVEARKQSNKGRLTSHVWCWRGWVSIDQKRKEKNSD